MDRVSRFVVWICSKFNRQQIELIVHELLDILNNRNPEVKPKDEFKEKHPQYRKFSIDPNPPLKEKPSRKSKRKTKNYKLILAEYATAHGKPMRPVNRHLTSPRISDHVICHCCSAPPKYLYYNDGNKRSQIRCKVCHHLFQLDNPFRKKKPNITARIVSWHYLSGKSVRKSPSTNAVMITVHTASKTLTGLIKLNAFCAQDALHSLNSVITTGSTTVSPFRFDTLHP